MSRKRNQSKVERIVHRYGLRINHAIEADGIPWGFMLIAFEAEEDEPRVLTSGTIGEDDWPRLLRAIMAPKQTRQAHVNEKDAPQ